ncbi:MULTISPECIES: hypothetical protein [Agrococcus]|uniref:Uncharacterized protein n=1 Tax=Agrococcus pavilionensis RW1 TaxID=1330458 RepID=U1MUX2_9MICO|nr:MULTISPECIES: hypothetical protein [Agrococcus]ERG64450.1 hypothetical protein L332_08305 [Agrococcus pavilionensis RW1]MBO1769987.1 hypothetical protein [Agrococcus sp. TF02-05]
MTAAPPPEVADASPGVADPVWSGVLLALPLLAAFPALVLMGILWFASQGHDDWWTMRGWSELLVWQLPIGLWLATLVAVVVLAVRRRRALPAAAIGVAAIMASMVVGLVLPLLLVR